LDRSLGLVFGLVRGAAVVALAYLIFAALFPPEDRPAWVTEARTEPFMAEGAEVLAAILPERWVAQSVDAADGATRAAGQAIETGKAVQPLAEPIFKAPVIETKAEPGDPGYKDQERKDLERLIQSSQ
jgi:membrane protein required for colicin V production